MIYLESPLEAKQWCVAQRNRGKTVGYIPTMGAIHEGHISLVRKALKENTVTCTSIFVNPLQFNNQEDLEKYPRDLNSDLEMLRQAGCSMAYTGTLNQFFPEVSDIKQIEKKSGKQVQVARGLEADFRPGYLEGVWTIVERLFIIVGHCNAYFGEKDFQQTLLIKGLAKKIISKGIYINIVVCPTFREPSGLAMSSRNRYLTLQQKESATSIYQTLITAKQAWGNGIRSAEQLQSLMLNQIAHSDLKIEYATVRDPIYWTEHVPNGKLEQAQGLIAGFAGNIRLIDNLRLDDVSSIVRASFHQYHRK